MPVTQPRNRVVLFRLTQEEYQRLQTACAEGAARSISDFARARVLGAPPEVSSLAQIEAKLAELSQAIETLTRRVEQSQTPRADAATASHASGRIFTNSGD